MLPNLNDVEGPVTRTCEDALPVIVGDFEGLTCSTFCLTTAGGTGDVALDPTLLPQSEGTALRGVLFPELESFKLAQLLLTLGPGACDGFPTGLLAGLATAAFGSSSRASAKNCGGTIIEELPATLTFRSPELVTSLSELGLSGIPRSLGAFCSPQSGPI